MLFATEIVGASAYDSQAHFVGRVREFFVEPAEQPNRISHFLISRGRFQPLVARYDQVSKVAPGRIDLNVSERALAAYKPNEAWLAVQKDLLDQQIIDTEGRKVVRVNDVDLSELRTNEHVELRIAQVDVGLTGAMRRLVLGIAAVGVGGRGGGDVRQTSIRGRGLQGKRQQRPIRWEFVNLIEPDPLRRVKLRITHEKLEDLHPADLAELMEHLSAAERQGIIASLDEHTAAEVLAELDERLTTQIVERLEPGKAADILEEMAPDAAADLLADLPKETSEELLEEMPNLEAEEVRELLSYDSATAGGMMNTEFAYVSEASAREEVLGWLRKQDFNLEQLDTIVLVDAHAQFSGTVPMARMLLAAPEQLMSELKTEPLVSITPDASEKDVFELFDKYNLRMLTVIDEEKRPIGTVTVDDVVSRLVNA